MRFAIDRASYHRSDPPAPCPEAFRVGGDDEHWWVDFESLDELKAFMEREGSVILSVPDPEDLMYADLNWRLTIYDYYVE